MENKINSLSIGTRKDKQLADIQAITKEMFEQVEKMIDLTVILYENSSMDIAMEIVDEDLYLDGLQKDVIVEVNHFIIREQPKATDLRIALGTYKLAADLERLGDYFKGYAKLQLKELELNKKQRKIFLENITVLKQQLNETKIAYLNVNHQLAKVIAKRDEGIKSRTRIIISELSNDMLNVNDAQEIEKTVKIIMQVRTLSRANDHLINICEQISYIANGQIYHYS